MQMNGGIMVPEEKAANGECDMAELLVIGHLVKMYNPRVVFEFGTYRGTTTATMALNSPDDCEVYTLDIIEQPPSMNGRNQQYEWDMDFSHPEDVGISFRNPECDIGKKATKKITQLWGDSMTYDFSPWYDKCDLVFVDASHEYENALSDIRQALEMVSRTGAVLVHDFAVWYPTVMQAVGEIVTASQMEFYVWQGTTLCGIGNMLADFMEGEKIHAPV